jgi:hypothetical protein
MPWFNVDDGFAFHHKAVKAGNAAIGLWTRAGSWCAQQLTDGFVPDEMVLVLGSQVQADRLVAAGLWMTTEGGYQFHEFTENGRNPTKKDVMERRRKEAERKARFREQKASNPEEPQVTKDSPTGTGASVPVGVPVGVRDSPPLPSPPKEEEPSLRSGSRARANPASQLFEEFWSAYPRKVGKAGARKAWPKACKKLEAARLVKAADYWAGLWQQAGTDAQFIPHPATWLNGERWNDEPPVARGQPTERRSTTDERVAQAQSLKALYLDEPSNVRQLPGAAS